MIETFLGVLELLGREVVFYDPVDLLDVLGKEYFLVGCEVDVCLRRGFLFFDH